MGMNPTLSQCPIISWSCEGHEDDSKQLQCCVLEVYGGLGLGLICLLLYAWHLPLTE